jgi:hypothetical protein
MIRSKGHFCFASYIIIIIFLFGLISEFPSFVVSMMTRRNKVADLRDEVLDNDEYDADDGDDDGDGGDDILDRDFDFLQSSSSHHHRSYDDVNGDDVEYEGEELFKVPGAGGDKYFYFFNLSGLVEEGVGGIEMGIMSLLPSGLQSLGGAAISVAQAGALNRKGMIPVVPGGEDYPWVCPCDANNKCADSPDLSACVTADGKFHSSADASGKKKKKKKKDKDGATDEIESPVVPKINPPPA